MAPMSSSSQKRREFRRIHILDLATYKWPLAAFASIMHRASGAFMFIVLPFVLWLFDNSVSSEISFDRFTALFNGQIFLPGWFWKLVVLSIVWAFLHHMCAGIKHLIMDASHRAINKRFSRLSTSAIFLISLHLLGALAAKLFGLY